LYLYQRISPGTTLRLFREHAGLSVADLALRSATNHVDATFSPTGGARIDPRSLERLRESVVGVARAHGYPAEAGQKTAAAIRFDQDCTRVLYEQMRIIAADAASEGVWSFLTCVLLPDVACWRFPDRSEERLRGHFRNVFRRLWWRAYILGATASDPPAHMGEDTLVQVMERPTLGSNPRVARTLCVMFLEQKARFSDVAASELMRDATKRLIRLTPFLSLYALDDETLRGVIKDALVAAGTALRSLLSRPRTEPADPVSASNV